jgi:D-3-phosphoglycerate dehydrogenase / 2-oxoglutarate reductase
MPKTCCRVAVKNLILAMNGEKPIAQVNPEVPVKKVV